MSKSLADQGLDFMTFYACVCLDIDPFQGQSFLEEKDVPDQNKHAQS